MNKTETNALALLVLGGVMACSAVVGAASAAIPPQKTRIIMTSDGEIDDECSLVRFLLYVNEWDVEGIITHRLTAAGSA